MSKLYFEQSLKKLKLFPLLPVLFFVLFVLTSDLLSADQKESKVMKLSQELCMKLVADYQKNNANPGKRGKLAVLDLDVQGETAKKKGIGTGVGEILSVQMAKLDRFDLIERKRLSVIMQEFQLEQTGLVDETTTHQLGRILAADLLLTGSVTEMGANYSVVARIVDVETATIKASAEISVPAAELIPVVRVVTMEEKYPVTSLFRSMVMPGWGSFNNNTPTRGWIYFGATVAGISTGLFSFTQYKISENSYHALNEVNFRGYVEDAKNPNEAADFLAGKAEKYQSTANIIFLVTAGIYVVNCFDALLTAIDNNRKIRDFKIAESPSLFPAYGTTLSFNSTTGDASFSCSFKF